MKPVFQDRADNCMQACIASILELSLNEVPNFIDAEDFGQAINDFLAQYDMYHVCVPADIDFAPVGYHVISGESPRNNGVLHACVGLNGAIVHDPHRDGGGLKSIDYFEVFCVKMSKPKEHGVYSKSICPECGDDMPMGAIICDGCVKLHRLI